MSLTAEDLSVLSAPFPDDRVGVKVQSLSKERNKAMLVCYAQHTDVYDRLERVDPAWQCAALHEQYIGDTYVVRMRMTIKGVARENVGEGSDPKSAYSDALKRVAMLFGIGRYFYDSETVWVDYNDQKDKFRAWTLAEFQTAAKKKGVPQLPTGPSGPQAPGQPRAQAPAPKSSPVTPNKPAPNQAKADLEEEIMTTAYRMKLSNKDLFDWAKEVTGKEPNLMTVEDMRKFLDVLKVDAGQAGVAV